MYQQNNIWNICSNANQLRIGSFINVRQATLNKIYWLFCWEKISLGFGLLIDRRRHKYTISSFQAIKFLPCMPAGGPVQLEGRFRNNLLNKTSKVSLNIPPLMFLGPLLITGAGNFTPNSQLGQKSLSYIRWHLIFNCDFCSNYFFSCQRAFRGDI